MVLRNGDQGNVTYILLLLLANVLLSISIVSFVWNVISGKGIVDHSDNCHNCKVAKGEVWIRLTECLADSFHPVHAIPMEAGSWTVTPINKILQ